MCFSERRRRRACPDLRPAGIADEIDLERNVRACHRYFRQYRTSRRHYLHAAACDGVYDEVLLGSVRMVCHAPREGRFRLRRSGARRRCSVGGCSPIPVCLLRQARWQWRGCRSRSPDRRPRSFPGLAAAARRCSARARDLRRCSGRARSRARRAPSPRSAHSRARAWRCCVAPRRQPSPELEWITVLCSTFTLGLSLVTAALCAASTSCFAWRCSSALRSCVLSQPQSITATRPTPSAAVTLRARHIHPQNDRRPIASARSSRWPSPPARYLTRTPRSHTRACALRAGGRRSVSWARTRPARRGA